MSKIKLTNHIIICGWNFQGPRIVEELLRANRDTNIVILVDSDKHPLKGSNKSHRVDFVRGRSHPGRGTRESMRARVRERYRTH